jgi:hypothetical protein
VSFHLKESLEKLIGNEVTVWVDSIYYTGLVLDVVNDWLIIDDNGKHFNIRLESVDVWTSGNTPGANMHDGYKFWRVTYISCEGNERWCLKRCPDSWTHYDVGVKAQSLLGGCGDDTDLMAASGAFGSPASLSPDVTPIEIADSIAKWEQVQDHILALLRLEDNWDGEGAPQIRPELVRSALHLVHKLMAIQYGAPQDVYPLPDATIILEWQYQHGIIERIEVERVGQGELMVTFPNAPAHFSEITWPPAGTPCVMWLKSSAWKRQVPTKFTTIGVDLARGLVVTWIKPKDTKGKQQVTPAELRKITEDAIKARKDRADEIAARKSKAAARKLALDKAKAQKIIDSILDRAKREAEAGRSHAVVMSVRYEDYERPGNENNYTVLKPEWFKTVCRLVWEHCVTENLNPTLEHWHDGCGIEGGHNIVIHW